MGANAKTSSIGQPVPELPVADVERAQRHYRDALGFEIGWLYPGKDIGAVSRGRAAIFFRTRKPPFEPAVHWVFAEDVDALYEELKSSGAKIVDPLETKSWGLRQFTVEDLDGNLLYFHHEAPTAAESTSATREQASPRPMLNSIEAQLFVSDIQRSCDFFESKLDFAIRFTHGAPPCYAQVSCDNVQINLRLICEPVFVGDIRKREHLLSASITVATAQELKELYLCYESAGVVFDQALKKEPWGATTFVVSDPDDNLILFAGPEAD